MAVSAGSPVAFGNSTLRIFREAIVLISAGQTPLFTMARYCVLVASPVILKVVSWYAGPKFVQLVASRDDCQFNTAPVLPVNTSTAPWSCPMQIFLTGGVITPATLLGSTMIVDAVLVSILQEDPFCTTALKTVVACRFCAV